jgi:hypothetical protein
MILGQFIITTFHADAMVILAVLAVYIMEVNMPKSKEVTSCLIANLPDWKAITSALDTTV